MIQKSIAIAFLLSAEVTAGLCQVAAPRAIPLGAFSQSLQAPARLAADSAGNIYVTDPVAGQVVVFDASGLQVTSRGGFSRPLGIAIDAQNHIYLAEEQAGSVSVFDTQWNLLGKLGLGNGEFQLPNHIALAPASFNNRIYVSDSKANTIRVYTGFVLSQVIGGGGSGPGQFDFPSGLCVSAKGELFVVDQNNDRVQVFDGSGSFARVFALGTGRPSGRSQAVFIDSSARLYAADSFQGTVKVFDSATGTPLSNVGSFGSATGQLSSPAGLALDSYGRLLVASANNRRVELYGLDTFVHLSTTPASGTIAAGTILTFTVTAGGAGPFAYQWQKDGQPLAGETNANFIIPAADLTASGRYSILVTGPTGALTSYAAPIRVLTPPAIEADPQSLTVLRGSNVLMEVGVTGSALTCQWLLNGLKLEGATNRTLFLPDAQSFQAGAYSVVVGNSIGSVLSAPAVLTVLVPPTVAEIVSAFMAGDGFHLTLNADPGFQYSLDASTDLVNWEPLGNPVLDAGMQEFIDSGSTNFWNRFYRLRWVP